MKDGRLGLVYFVPEGGSFAKKTDLYDCCENEEILKTYKSLKHKLETC